LQYVEMTQPADKNVGTKKPERITIRPKGKELGWRLTNVTTALQLPLLETK